jgi:predicted NUDIX family NTP pyrophosphohydrolase
MLLFRRDGDTVRVLIGHMGGPFWSGRDRAAWSIPKGEYGPEEEPLDAARREFTEELGVEVPAGDPFPLGEVRQSGGKRVRVWALEGDVDLSALRFGEFEMEWPPGSGVMRAFPELDQAAWYDLDEAADKLVTAQTAFLDRLRTTLAEPRGDGSAQG